MDCCTRQPCNSKNSEHKIEKLLTLNVNWVALMHLDVLQETTRVDWLLFILYFVYFVDCKTTLLLKAIVF